MLLCYKLVCFREAKAHNIPKSMTEMIPHFGNLVSVKCNCNGTRVSMIITKVCNSASYIFCAEFIFKCMKIPSFLIIKISTSFVTVHFKLLGKRHFLCELSYVSLGLA